MNWVRSLSVAVVLFTAVIPLSAAEHNLHPRVAVHHTGHLRSDVDLERILARAAELELRGAHLLIASSDQLPARDDGMIDIDQAYAAYEATDLLSVELLLLGNYELADERLTIRYQLVDVTKPEVLSEVEREGAVDMLLDRLIAEAVKTLVEDSRDDIDAVRQQRQQAVLAQREEIDDELRAGQLGPDGNEHRAPDKPGPSVASSGRLDGRIELNVGGQAIVSLGEFARYLPYGYSAGGTLLLWLSESRVRTGIGLSVGYQNFFSSTDGMAEFIRSFVPVGAELRFSPWRSDVISTHLFAIAGAAIRIDDGSVASQRLAAALPYGAGGLSACVSVAGRFGVGAQLGMRSLFHIYREDPGADPQVELIPGFLAGIYAYQSL
ncbi:MAG: hypothetical protein LC641_04215 [Spirochaeta sp.]|nr:hypothetical protein [Spirochaeta sp.]